MKSCLNFFRSKTCRWIFQHVTYITMDVVPMMWTHKNFKKILKCLVRVSVKGSWSIDHINIVDLKGLMKFPLNFRSNFRINHFRFIIPRSAFYKAIVLSINKAPDYRIYWRHLDLLSLIRVDDSSSDSNVFVYISHQKHDSRRSVIYLHVIKYYITCFWLCNCRPYLSKD